MFFCCDCLFDCVILGWWIWDFWWCWWFWVDSVVYVFCFFMEFCWYIVLDIFVVLVLKCLFVWKFLIGWLIFFFVWFVLFGLFWGVFLGMSGWGCFDNRLDCVCFVCWLLLVELMRFLWLFGIFVCIYIFDGDLFRIVGGFYVYDF